MRFRISTMLLTMAMIAMAIGWWTDWRQHGNAHYLHLIRAGRMNGNRLIPPEIVLSVPVILNRDFQVELPRGQSISGRIDASAFGSNRAKLNGDIGGYLEYEGPLELESLTQTPQYIDTKTYVVALSRSPSAKALLAKQELADRTAVQQQFKK